LTGRSFRRSLGSGLRRVAVEGGDDQLQRSVGLASVDGNVLPNFPDWVRSGGSIPIIPLDFGETVTGVTVNLPAGATFNAPVYAGRSEPGAGAPNGFLLFHPPVTGGVDGVFDLTITSD
jgi:hypothetical protein